jgi:hypothetical protein
LVLSIAAHDPAQPAVADYRFADAAFVAHRLLRAGPARTDWRGKPQIVLPMIVATHNMLPMHEMI